ncbi:MAG TPA: amidohydrolase family protein [Pseudomonadales bacterium]
MPIRTLLMLIAGSFGVPLHAAAPDADRAWVLGGAKVYPAPDAAPIEDGVVVVRAGRIAAVGGREAVSIPAGARESECGGGFVVAGFQNSHVHFTGAEFAGAATAPAARLQQALTGMLTQHGFTTVVDTGSDRDNTLALRARIERGELLGPRILTVGNPLFPVDGIPAYLADYPKELLDRMPQPATPSDAVAVVRDNLEAGADGTKLFVATPQADGSIRRMAGPIARGAADETHRHDKLAMAHPTDVEGIRTALDAGVDVLVHTTLGVESAWPEPLVRQLVEHDVSLVPTLKLWHYELDKESPPDAIRQRLVEATFAQLRGFAAAGGQILFGTDVGYMSDADPADEFALMADAGLTPMQILESLTTAPAARWNESDRRGRLDAGLAADIVVLGADPIADPAAFAEVRCTFRDGVRIDGGGR